MRPPREKLEAARIPSESVEKATLMPRNQLGRIRSKYFNDGKAIADYGDRIHQAEEFGDIGLKVNLENQVSDEARRKEDIERILAGWSE